jgi:CRP/FNR family transcriptional regulator, anaerobic regulatory protein
MNLILQNIAKYVSLTSSEEALILSKTETKKYKAKTILLSSGEVSNCTYFVNSGILRSFTINDTIIEPVLHFVCEGFGFF